MQGLQIRIGVSGNANNVFYKEMTATPVWAWRSFGTAI
jgi:hypothetical protein